MPDDGLVAGLRAGGRVVAEYGVRILAHYVVVEEPGSQSGGL